MVRPEVWLGRIKAERDRQEAKWHGGPGDLAHPHTLQLQRLAILAEEVGEVAKAILEYDGEPASLEELETEVLQVAAVACAWLEGMDAFRMEVAARR